MTRLLTCGYETGDVAEAGSTTTGVSGTLSVVSATPAPRAGTYCLKASATQAVTNNAYKTFVLAASKTEVWVRWAIYINLGTNSANQVLAGMFDSGGAAQTCISWDASSSVLTARQGVGLPGTSIGSGGTLSPSAWHVLEWRIQITSTSAGTTEVWLDGTRVINVSGDNTATATANVQQIALGSIAVANTSNFYTAIDDIAINDTAGTTNNGRPGDGRVVLLVPNGAGSNTALTRGGTDSGANWSQVEELPPSMTDYVYSATAATRDTYALTDLVVTPSAINAVEVIALAQNSDAGAGSLGLTVKSGATTNEGSAQSLGTAAAYIRQLYETDPATSTAWTASGVNALEAGVTVR
jgi:hypothetical protein